MTSVRPPLLVSVFPAPRSALHFVNLSPWTSLREPHSVEIPQPEAAKLSDRGFEAKPPLERFQTKPRGYRGPITPNVVHDAFMESFSRRQISGLTRWTRSRFLGREETGNPGNGKSSQKQKIHSGSVSLTKRLLCTVKDTFIERISSPVEFSR